MKFIELLKDLESERELDQIVIIHNGKEYLYNMYDWDELDEYWLNMTVIDYSAGIDDWYHDDCDDDLHWVRAYLDN